MQLVAVCSEEPTCFATSLLLTMNPLRQALAGELGEEEAVNQGQQKVSVFSTATKRIRREPCGLSSRLLEKASSQFQLSWRSRTAEAGSPVPGCNLLVSEHLVALVTQGSSRQEPATRPGAEPALL